MEAGEPDLVLRAEGTWTPRAAGDSWRCYVLPAPEDHDLYINGFEFLSAEPGSVHHMLAYIDTSGKAVELDAMDPGAGYDYQTHGLGFDPAGLVGFHTPGEVPFIYPEGTAIRIPAGAAIVLQTHYHIHDGSPEPDQPRVGLHLAHSTITRLLRFMTIFNGDLYLPAGDPEIPVTQTFVVTEPIRIYALDPHMHSLGRRFLIEAHWPDGSSSCMIRIDNWDPRWQGMYQLAEPLLLPAGSSIFVEADYDNSTANPRNPHNPPRDVWWGESAEDEMLIAGVVYALENEEVHIEPEP